MDILKSIVRVLLDELQSFCGTRLNGAFERFGVAAENLHIVATADTRVAYLMVPLEGSTSGVISTPFSTTFDTLKAANDIAADSHTEASARCKPAIIRSRQLHVHPSSVKVY